MRHPPRLDVGVVLAYWLVCCVFFFRRLPSLPVEIQCLSRLLMASHCHQQAFLAEAVTLDFHQKSLVGCVTSVKNKLGLNFILSIRVAEYNTLNQFSPSYHDQPPRSDSVRLISDWKANQPQRICYEQQFRPSV